MGLQYIDVPLTAILTFNQTLHSFVNMGPLTSQEFPRKGDPHGVSDPLLTSEAED